MLIHIKSQKKQINPPPVYDISQNCRIFCTLYFDGWCRTTKNMKIWTWTKFVRHHSEKKISRFDIILTHYQKNNALSRTRVQILMKNCFLAFKLGLNWINLKLRNICLMYTAQNDWYSRLMKWPNYISNFNPNSAGLLNIAWV